MTNYYGIETVLNPALIKITQSDLAAFKRDRRVWFLKTYLGLRPKRVQAVGPLVLGSIVHAALEARYKFGEDMMPWYQAEVQRQGTEFAALDPYFQWSAWHKQAEQGRIMLEGYVEWIDEGNLDVRYRQWAIEHLLQVHTEYDGTPVVLTGKADMIVRDTLTDELMVWDWKTSAQIDRTVRQAHSTEQLPFYISLLKAQEPTERIGGAAFNILLKSKRTDRAKPPFYHREFVNYDRYALAARQASIDGTIRDYVRVVNELNAGVTEPLRTAYANPGVISFDTDLNSLIDVMDTGGNVTGIIRSQYQQIDPYGRYAEPESPLLVED